ncbi:MAG TPA: PEGA domain-containing protein, partial [Kofleriaceae bacterium]
IKKAPAEPGMSPKTAPSAPTMIAPPPVRSSIPPAPTAATTSARPEAANEQTVLAGIPADQETSDARETVMLDRNGEARPAPYPGRPSAQLPTEFVSPLSGPRAQLDAPPASRPLAPSPHDVRQRRIRIASAIAGLVGLMLISFTIALCASRSRKKIPVAAPAGDASLLLALEPADAATADAEPAPPPADARAVDPGSGAERRTEKEAYLEIVTIPGGGKLKVGDQVRVAPAQIVVEAGTFDVTGELPGFQPEIRHVAIEAGEHLKIELTFNHKLGAPAHVAPALGRLTIRTTPYSEVFENGRKLDQTPFADREMTAGPHTLVFKNPLHPTVTKRITIAAGKSLKLNFALPD